MKRLILPLLLALIGLGAGLGAGFFLRPAPEAPVIATISPMAPATPPPGGTEIQRLPSQFVVPVIAEGQVRAMVVLGLALDMLAGQTLDMQRDEPRLRSIFLQILFDHANLGGFDGVFTSGEHLLALRRTLLEAARTEFGTAVHDVLILDLMRQDS